MSCKIIIEEERWDEFHPVFFNASGKRGFRSTANFAKGLRPAGTTHFTVVRDSCFFNVPELGEKSLEVAFCGLH